jgi:rhomboid family GlyGly-CTERM serine protease
MQQPASSSRGWQEVAWTLGLSVLVFILNAGLSRSSPPMASAVLTNLQFDGAAIRDGEYWRLLTGNFVHWTPAHLFFDLTGFVVLGLLYERSFRRSYPLLVIVTALAVGIAGLVCWPEETRMRGLSGVDWGLVAAGLCLELGRSRQVPARLLWVLPAAGIFLSALIYQEVSGRFLLLSSSQATGKPAPFAHTAGALSAVIFVSGWRLRRAHSGETTLTSPSVFLIFLNFSRHARESTERRQCRGTAKETGTVRQQTPP